MLGGMMMRKKEPTEKERTIIRAKIKSLMYKLFSSKWHPLYGDLPDKLKSFLELMSLLGEDQYQLQSPFIVFMNIIHAARYHCGVAFNAVHKPGDAIKCGAAEREAARLIAGRYEDLRLQAFRQIRQLNAMPWERSEILYLSQAVKVWRGQLRDEVKEGSQLYFERVGKHLIPYEKYGAFETAIIAILEARSGIWKMVIEECEDDHPAVRHRLKISMRLLLLLDEWRRGKFMFPLIESHKKRKARKSRSFQEEQERKEARRIAEREHVKPTLREGGIPRISDGIEIIKQNPFFKDCPAKRIRIWINDVYPPESHKGGRPKRHKHT
jgi:hypothetical protein